jgi:uncharacterized protein DUF3106
MIWTCNKRLRRLHRHHGDELKYGEAQGGEMRQAKYRVNWLATAGLMAGFAISLPCLARTGAFHPPQEQHAAQTPAPPPAHAAPAPPPQHQRPERQPQVSQQPRGHAGDWLRRYKDLPPAEQERELESDPAFRRLTPERQQRLRQRLQHFSNLPPQEQLQMLNRMETWEHLTPAQKQEARQIFGQMRQLPPDRQRMVTTAVRDLRAMPPDQRETLIDSERFKRMFSDQERTMMREATRLPLAPPEGAENGPQE